VRIKAVCLLNVASGISASNLHAYVSEVCRQRR